MLRSMLVHDPKPALHYKFTHPQFHKTLSNNMLQWTKKQQAEVEKLEKERQKFVAEQIPVVYKGKFYLPYTNKKAPRKYAIGDLVFYSTPCYLVFGIIAAIHSPTKVGVRWIAHHAGFKHIPIKGSNNMKTMPEWNWEKSRRNYGGNADIKFVRLAEEAEL